MMQRKYRIARLVYALVETAVTVVSFLLAYGDSRPPAPGLFRRVVPLPRLRGTPVGGGPAVERVGPADSAAARPSRPATGWVWSRKRALLVFLGGVLISAAIFLLKYHYISRPFILIFVLVNFLLLLAFRLFAARGVTRFGRLVSGDRNLLIVGSGESCRTGRGRSGGGRVLGVPPGRHRAGISRRRARFPAGRLSQDSTLQNRRGH